MVKRPETYQKDPRYKHVSFTIASGRKSSPMWDYFLINKEQGLAECQICGKVQKARSASNPIRHVSMKHVDIYKEFLNKVKEDRKKEVAERHNSVSGRTAIQVDSEDEDSDQAEQSEDDDSVQGVKRQGKIIKRQSTFQKDPRYTHVTFSPAEPKRSSPIWNFVLVNKQRNLAECQVCGKVLKGISSSNLIRHMGKKHKQHYKQNTVYSLASEQEDSQDEIVKTELEQRWV